MMDDKTLVFRVLGGDMQSFRTLIKQNERLVAHMVGKLIRNREELEEICQDVFLKVYNRLADFNFQSKLSTWIATIAYRHAINASRKRQLNTTELSDHEVNSAFFADTETPQQIIEDRDMEEYILKLVDLLPDQYKIVLTLYHLENMTYEEIGQVTGMPEGTVKNYLFRARTLLKEKVKKVMIQTS
jgi:RNA polymerase sigma factor (sigma-70 family)